MQFSSRILLGDRTSRSVRNVLNSGRLKRVIDVGGALFALAMFSPVLLVCAIAIRLGGASSAIFRQERIGRFGKPFQMIKLTTMQSDAHLKGPLLSKRNDPRVTAVGQLIRAYGINELTQFVNVLRGEMSIIGPRPEVPKFVETWPPAVAERVLSARPGITGLAQLHFFWREAAMLADKNDVEKAYVEEILPLKLSLDLWYVNNRTLGLDIRILASTLIRCLGVSRLFPSTSIPAKILSSEDTA